MATMTKDAVLSSAAELARAAAEEVAETPELVGDYLGLVVEGERLVSHRFATTAPGYRGWTWNVTVARVPRGRVATVCEVDLLPGDDAILAPPWLPWSERLRPGDLGPGDVLPYQEEDERLDQGFEVTGDADTDELAIFELGLGRPRVLSWYGRSEAAQRWYSGSHGPMAPTAVAASAPCSTCGFLLLVAGSLRTEFGVCANEWSPDDGRVVSMDHGCGAHSETDLAPAPSDWPDPSPVVGEVDLELVRLIDDQRAEPEPEDAEPEDAEPEDAAPEDAAPEDAAPEDARPEDAVDDDSIADSIDDVPTADDSAEGEPHEPAADVPPAEPLEAQTVDGSDLDPEPVPGEE